MLCKKELMTSLQRENIYRIRNWDQYRKDAAHTGRPRYLFEPTCSSTLGKLRPVVGPPAL